MTIFKSGLFTLHSGSESRFKIDLDGLTTEDWETLAAMVANNFPYHFGEVYGIPKGGVPFADALQKYCKPDKQQTLLIVDDVMTTGNSFREAYEMSVSQPKYKHIFGVVVFARGNGPEWVFPMFNLDGWII